MSTKRAGGKKLIGAQASKAIWDGVDEWLRRNPRKSVSDFVIEASMEKLELAQIPFDREAAMFDGRRRVPGLPGDYPAHRPAPYIMNETEPKPLTDAQQLAQKAGDDYDQKKRKKKS